MDAELLPCPFCGSEAKSYTSYRFGGISYAVMCANDGYQKCSITNEEGEWKTEEAAIIAWNTRTLVNPHLSRYEIVEEHKGEVKPNASFTLVGGEWVENA